MKDDIQAWNEADPEDLWVYDKLYIAKRLGYNCGPSGLQIPKLENTKWIVRPITSFCGMSAGAHIYRQGKTSFYDIPLGYFWSEYFEGEQYSVDYLYGEQYITYRAVRPKKNPLYKFKKWVRADKEIIPPKFIKDVLDKYDHTNVEYIVTETGPKVIEVHLRCNPNPDVEEMIPVWASDDGQKLCPKGFVFEEAYGDADGYLEDQRLGFYVRR